MPDLTLEERTRLVGILGRLGSDFDGERAAAGLLASRLLRNHGLTWADLLGGASQRDASRRGESSNSSLGLCLCHLKHLTEWEQQFCRSLAGRSRLSPKQAAVTQKIVDGLRARGLD